MSWSRSSWRTSRPASTWPSARREDPPLPLARLRARDQITEIREHALRFNVEEGGAFFNRTMGLSLAPESVATLLSRTEGWITGLQLAGVALRQPAGGPRLQSATDDFVAAFAGDDRYVVDYLMAEVLERESGSVRDFLRQTSILERLSAPLCDDLTGRDDSAAVLEHLEAANLFLLPLDNRREWFRYHVLFAEVLRLSLTAQEQIELAPASGRLVRGPRLARIRRAPWPPRRRGVASRPERAGVPRPRPSR